MTTASISRDTALRVALAARTIPDLGVATLLEILQNAIPGELTEQSLKRITVSGLRMGIAGADSELDVDPASLARAVDILHGAADIDRVPTPEDNAEPLGESIRVAVASNDGEELNGHFGSCVRFLIYDISATAQRLVDVRSTLGSEKEDDKNAYRANLIADCQVLYVISIGGPAAAKVIRCGIYPIKQTAAEPARGVLLKLQKVMASSPPPWLAKILGAAPESRVRFQSDEDSSEAAYG